MSEPVLSISVAGQLRGRADTPGSHRSLDRKHGQQMTEVGVSPLQQKNTIKREKPASRCAGFLLFLGRSSSDFQLFILPP